MTQQKSYTREEIIIRIQEIYKLLEQGHDETLEQELHSWQHVMSHFREHGGMPSMVDD